MGLPAEFCDYNLEMIEMNALLSAELIFFSRLYSTILAILWNIWMSSV